MQDLIKHHFGVTAFGRLMLDMPNVIQRRVLDMRFPSSQDV